MIGGECAGFDVEIALREGDLDVIIAEGLPDSKEDFGADIADAIRGVIDPKADLKVDGGISKFFK